MDTLAVDADDLIAQRTEEGWNGWPLRWQNWTFTS